MKKLIKNFKFWTFSLIIILVISIVLSISIGSTFIEPSTVYKYLTNEIFNSNIFTTTWDAMSENIIWEIRVPRVLLAAICGAGLALCGVLMQCVTKNPVADPYILGISSGASTGAVFVIVFGVAGVFGITTAAFIGATLCGVLVFTIGTNMGKSTSTTRLVLTGMAISTVFSSITNLIIYSAENANESQKALFWIMGGLGSAQWSKLLLPLLVLIICFLISIFISRSLDVLLFGDNSAVVLGLNVSRVKTLILFVSILLTATLVSITGAIGFIGLIVPHICRYSAGTNHKKLIVLSVLLGAVLLIWSDAIIRGVLAPKEMPIGIITSLIGGPFFLWLVTKSNYSFGGKNDG